MATDLRPGDSAVLFDHRGKAILVQVLAIDDQIITVAATEHPNIVYQFPVATAVGSTIRPFTTPDA